MGVLSILRRDQFFKRFGGFLLFDLLGNLLGIGESRGTPELVAGVLQKSFTHKGASQSAICVDAAEWWRGVRVAV